MAKQEKKEEARELTRKQQHRKRKDVEQNRRVLIGLGIAVGLILILIAAGIAQEMVLKPRQPVATVNGTAITGQDYAKAVKYSWMQQGLQQGQDPVAASQQVLDQMVDEELVREQAGQRGINVTQDDIDKAIEQGFGFQRTPPTPSPTPAVSPTPSPTQTPNPTPGTPSPTETPAPTATPVTRDAYQTAYKSFLTRLQQQTGMSEADFRKQMEVSLLQRKLFDAVTADTPAKDEEVHARHILVSIVPEPPTPTPLPAGQTAPTATPSPTPGGPTPAPTPAPRNDSQALARAQEVEQKLAAGGDFAKLAQQYSDDPGSKDKGGDLGWFGKGMMAPEFEQAAFGQEVGKVGQPVKTTYGYHIIQVLEKDPQHPIDQFTLQQKQYEAYQKWLDSQRTTAKIVKSWSADKVPPTPSAPGP